MNSLQQYASSPTKWYDRGRNPFCNSVESFVAPKATDALIVNNCLHRQAVITFSRPELDWFLQFSWFFDFNSDAVDGSDTSLKQAR
eukprot:IDg4913t1